MTLSLNLKPGCNSPLLPKLLTHDSWFIFSEFTPKDIFTLRASSGWVEHLSSGDVHLTKKKKNQLHEEKKRGEEKRREENSAFLNLRGYSS